MACRQPLVLAVLLLVAGLVQGQCSGHGTPLDGGGCDCSLGFIGVSCDVELFGNGCFFNATTAEELFCVNIVPLSCDGAWAVELAVEYSGMGVVTGQWVNYGNDSVSDLCTDLQENVYWDEPGGPNSYPLSEICLSFTDVYLDDTTVVANASMTSTFYSTEEDTYHSVLETSTLQIGSLSGSNAPCGAAGYHYGPCSLSWQQEPLVNGSNLAWSSSDNCVYDQGWSAFCPVVYFDPCAGEGFLTVSSGIRLSVPLAGAGFAWNLDCTEDATNCLALANAAINDTNVSYSMVVTINGDSVTYGLQTATFPSCGAMQCISNSTGSDAYVGYEDDGADDDGGDDGADDDDESNPNAGVYLAFLCFFIFLCGLGSVVAVSLLAYRLYVKKNATQDLGYGILNDGDGTKSLLEEMSDENDASEMPEPDFSF